MRIVIDMQGAQSENRHQGIGCYTMSFVQAIARNRGENEVVLALNGLFPETIDAIRTALDGLLPQDCIRVWQAPGPVSDCDPSNAGRREVAELIREAFLASLRPDVIHVSSLFEGYSDDAVTSIGRFDQQTPVSVSLYDLIPRLNPEPHLEQNLIYAQHYHRKIEHLKRAAMCLAISDSAVQDGALGLGSAIKKIVNIASTADLLRPDVVEQSILDNALVAAVSACDEAFWDQCAINAMEAFVSLAGNQKQADSSLTKSTRPRLAFVSPLPPERTGIADYSADLLPALAEYYEIDVVVAQDRVDDQWVNHHLKVRDVNWLRANADSVDRVLYHFGNSPFHQHMFSLLREIPGTVVLHDFFLGHLLAWMEYSGSSSFWKDALYLSHGYKALRNSYIDPDSARFDYPANLEILQSAHGVVFHSQYSLDLAQQWYGENLATACEVVPLLRSPAVEFDRAVARRKISANEGDFLVCSFGFLGSTKLNHRLIECWVNSAVFKSRNSKLVFVGENNGSDYGLSLVRYIQSRGLDDRVLITGFASPELYRDYLISADLAVQLRTNSRGETSAAVLDCLNYGLPLIVNANGSMAELDAEAVWMLQDEFEDVALSEALETLWREPAKRKILATRAKDVINNCHAPDKCALRYYEAIERFHKRAETATARLIDAIAGLDQFSPGNGGLLNIARNIAESFPLLNAGKRLFLDVTVTCQDDLKTGIQRVVRAVSLALLNVAPLGYRVEPVYLSEAGGEWHYRYAQRYTLELLGCSIAAMEDARVAPESGDVLLVLDLTGLYLLTADISGLYRRYRNQGVALYSVVYDLLPVRMPEVFPPDADFRHGKWLEAISKFDGAVCISKAVADDLASWQAELDIERVSRRPFRIGWFHLGADVASSSPTQGLPDNAEWTLRQLQARPSFLMVGTIEPRKGYLQTLEAFSQLWEEGVEVNLVIVGNEGWKGLPDMARRDIPKTIECLRSHSELDKHLFFLESISDEYLEKVYGASVCLIAASFGEGFGLPLIEAAQYKLPIVARDIPVFREVAGNNAYFFQAEDGPSSLVAAVQTWLGLYEDQRHPKSDAMPWLTWKKSAEQLLNCIFLEDA